MTTILIVDDNAINRKIIMTILQNANYHLLTANDGAEGLKIAHEQHIDLIISDIMMPSMDGYEFVYHLRANPTLVATKVIFYTAIFFEEAAKELARASGVSHFIVQPIDAADLLIIIEKVLNEPNPSFKLRPVDELHTRHRQLISKKLYEETKQLALLNQQLEQRIAEKTQLLNEANKALTVLSLHDQLTGLYNRRYLDVILEKQINSAKRHNKIFAVLLLDIDHYKKINDELGHEAGDFVLKEISNCIQNHIRTEDIVARYGGDEFIVILVDIDSKNALQRAELLRKSVETMEIYYDKKQLENLSISIGIAMYPINGKKEHILIKAADSALYKAKLLGKNHVVIAVEN